LSFNLPKKFKWTLSSIVKITKKVSDHRRIGNTSFELCRLFNGNKKRSFNVKKNEISIKTVEQDFFEDFMVFQARVEPMNSILVNIVEGGSVQEIFVSNGDMVIKGQPLARLYNPNTELNYMQQETAIIEQINNLNKAKLDLRNQELNLAKDLIAIEHDFQDAKNLFDLNKKLFDQEILAKNEWEKHKRILGFKRTHEYHQTKRDQRKASQSNSNRTTQSIHWNYGEKLEYFEEQQEEFLSDCATFGKIVLF